jgi:hypothetical protein
MASNTDSRVTNENPTIVGFAPFGLHALGKFFPIVFGATIRIDRSATVNWSTIISREGVCHPY